MIDDLNCILLYGPNLIGSFHVQSKNFPQCDGVSAWRTYFVANEWVKLSTARKSSMLVQLIAVAAILMVRPDGYQSRVLTAATATSFPSLFK